jgi:Fe-S oxidoreductase
MRRRLSLNDISRDGGDPLVEIDPADLMPLPAYGGDVRRRPDWGVIRQDQKARLVCNLDGVVAVGLAGQVSDQEKEKCVALFRSGLKKLLSREDNWAFLGPLLLSLDYCMQCQTCSEACPIYLASGRNDLYRPTYRAEIFRRLVNEHARPGGKLLARIQGADIELNWTTITRLCELSYRCTLCRRCAQACPMGVDNALLTRELRKLFSQELGWGPEELHQKGTLLQLEVGSPTGMRPSVAKDNIEFLDRDFAEATGMEISTPWDKTGADVLLIHSAGSILSWPENPTAFAILCHAAGIRWTLSSEVAGYDGVNYGVFYDDIQLARIAIRHAQIARKLGVRKIVMGECGHQHKALMAVADRVLIGDLDIPRESVMPFLENLVFSGKIRFDPSKNDFPVTLHDPCNIVRSLGIVEPQRRILRYLCPQFREMTPHGIDNYCCGGGGGLSLMSQTNFTDWKMNIAGRVKFRQVVEAFGDHPGPEVKKYVCAPCLNCKMQFRDLFKHYDAWGTYGIAFGGLAELIVNAMVGIRKPFIEMAEVAGETVSSSEGEQGG